MFMCKNQSNFECQRIRKQDFEIVIDFYELTFWEEETFNFGTYLADFKTEAGPPESAYTFMLKYSKITVCPKLKSYKIRHFIVLFYYCSPQAVLAAVLVKYGFSKIHSTCPIF